MKLHLACVLFLVGCSSFVAETGELDVGNDNGSIPVVVPSVVPTVTVSPVPNTVTFNKVYTEVLSSCANTCHNDNSGMSGGLNFADINNQLVAYQNLYNVQGSTYPNFIRVVPGNPNTSLLVLKLEGSTAATGAQMPLNAVAPLTPAQIQLVRDWITAGALNN